MNRDFLNKELYPSPRYEEKGLKLEEDFVQKDEENKHWLRLKERENNSYFFINKLSSCPSVGIVPNFVI